MHRVGGNARVRRRVSKEPMFSQGARTGAARYDGSSLAGPYPRAGRSPNPAPKTGCNATGKAASRSCHDGACNRFRPENGSLHQDEPTTESDGPDSGPTFRPHAPSSMRRARRRAYGRVQEHRPPSSNDARSWNRTNHNSEFPRQGPGPDAAGPRRRTVCEPTHGSGMGCFEHLGDLPVLAVRATRSVRCDEEFISIGGP